MAKVHVEGHSMTVVNETGRIEYVAKLVDHTGVIGKAKVSIDLSLLTGYLLSSLDDNSCNNTRLAYGAISCKRVP